MAQRLRGVYSAFMPFWLRASAAQSLLEAWALASLLLLAASSLTGDLTAFTISNLTFFSSAAAGFWLALRARLAKNRPWRQVFLDEALIGIALSLLVTGGILLLFQLTHRQAFLTKSVVGYLGSVIYLAGSGLAFYAARTAVWLLSYWNRLRRRNLMWSLTNALLSAVTIAGIFGAILFTLFALNSNNIPEAYREMAPAPRLISRLITSILPSLSIFTVLTVIGLAVLLPPSALISYLFARQTTRRLRNVVQAAVRFRSGDYAARVPVEGEDEVAQLQSDFNGMAETLEHTLDELRAEQQRVSDLLQSRRELVASVSHELRTPVATLRGYLDAALDSRDPAAIENLREDLEIMRREAIRLQSLLDDLFTLSRAEAHGLPLEMKPVDLEPLIRQRVAAIAPLAWQTGRVEVTAEIPARLPRALADPIRLEQVLINLLRNAIRYTPPGGIVAVLAGLEEKPAGSRLRIDVRDTGQGIAAEDLPHIWERFYRGNGAEAGVEAGAAAGEQADATGGAGLGLALVKELTEAMGGTVGVESIPGQGSCFTIWLNCDNFATGA